MEPAGPEHLARVRLVGLAATRTAVESHLAASLGEFPPKSAKFGKGKQSEALDSVTTPYSTLDCESDPLKTCSSDPILASRRLPVHSCSKKTCKHPNRQRYRWDERRNIRRSCQGVNIFRSLETGAMRFTVEYFWVIISR